MDPTLAQCFTKGNTLCVQLVAPAVPLQCAEHGYVRNSVTRVMLEKRGFTNVEVKRVKVERKMV